MMRKFMKRPKPGQPPNDMVFVLHNDPLMEDPGVKEVHEMPLLRSRADGSTVRKGTFKTISLPHDDADSPLLGKLGK